MKFHFSIFSQAFLPKLFIHFIRIEQYGNALFGYGSLIRQEHPVCQCLDINRMSQHAISRPEVIPMQRSHTGAYMFGKNVCRK